MTSQIRRKVVSSRQLTALHRTWELKLSCGDTNEWHMKNVHEPPKTRRCIKCEDRRRKGLTT